MKSPYSTSTQNEVGKVLRMVCSDPVVFLENPCPVATLDHVSTISTISHPGSWLDDYEPQPTPNGFLRCLAWFLVKR